MFTTITCLICLLVIIASLGILIYYAIDSFRQKEYVFCVGFVFYGILYALMIYKAISYVFLRG